MLIGTMQIDLYIPGSDSLKGKRFIIKSIKTRLRNKFNISIAEVADQDKWQKVQLGVACVSNERRFIDKLFSGVINFIDKQDRVEIIDYFTEVV